VNTTAAFIFQRVARRVLRRTVGRTCGHLDQIGDVSPSTLDGCEDCLRIGDTWVHLRMCLTCGHIGCCDNSKNKHATGHFQTQGHPIIRSFEPGEDWRWCYVDETLL
jgi:uncharacterized UBP type Zn finger protein